MDESLLRKLYCTTNLSMKEIADVLDVSRATISRYVKKLNLSRSENYSPKKPNLSKKDTKSKLEGKISEEKLKSMYIDNRMSQKEISEELGVSRRTVIYYMRKFGIKSRNPNHKNKYDEIPKRKLKELYVEKGWSIDDCAEYFNCSDTVIRKAAKKHNMEIRTATDYQFKHVPLKQVKKMYKEGKTSYEIAKEIGVDYKTILRRLRSAGIPIKNSGEYSSKVSEQESEVKEFIRSLGVEIKPNSRDIVSNYEVDVYVPERKLGIEYNGLYWHRDEIKGRKYHLKKNQAAEQAGIDLIQVWEHHWLNKQNIVKSIIKQRLGLSDRIYARKCKLREVSSERAKEFYEKNHLRGNIYSNHDLALLSEQDIVMMMSFRNNGDSMEISRICTKRGLSIIGGANKLFKNFVRKYKPKIIVSFCDLSYFNGGVYEKLGMQLVKITEPSYYYFDSQKDIVTRNRVQKHKLVEMGFDKKKSESEIMRDQGYHRFFDAGNKKYGWKFNT